MIQTLSRCCRQFSQCATEVFNQGKRYFGYEEPPRNRTYAWIKNDGTHFVITGDAKKWAIARQIIINRGLQIERISNAWISALGVYRYHMGLWNQSLLTAILAFPIAYALHKGTSGVIHSISDFGCRVCDSQIKAIIEPADGHGR